MNSNFILGSAQFGQAYGATNTTGLLSFESILEIIDYARNIGVRSIDTARSYGNAEIILGRAFKKLDFYPKITTKINVDCQASSNKSLEEVVKSEIEKSLRNLGINNIDCVLLHNFDDFKMHKNEIFTIFQKLVLQGKINKFGVSIYTPEEALFCLEDERLSCLQIPFNLLDIRWLSKEINDSFIKRPDVEVQTRSIFLQGLLINEAKYWPSFVDANKIISILKNLQEDLKKKSLLDLCITYVNSYNWISGYIIGIDNLSQIKDIGQDDKRYSFNKVELDKIITSLDEIPLKLLDPRKWYE